MNSKLRGRAIFRYSGCSEVRENVGPASMKNWKMFEASCLDEVKLQIVFLLVFV